MPCDVNANTQCQITSVSSLITIFFTETLMKEYDLDRDFWFISHFRCRKIDRNCVVSSVFPFYTHIFLLKKKWQPGQKPFSRVIWPGEPRPRAATANVTTLRSSICRRNSVCRLSVYNVCARYSAGWNFRQCFMPFCSLAIYWPPCKILWRASQGNPSVGRKTQEG